MTAALVRGTDARLGLMSRVASCFRDCRDPSAVEHTVQDLVSQQVYRVALGYEDLNDHDQLRRSRLMALLVGKSDITGGDRRRLRDQGNPLASPSGLNRLEFDPAREHLLHLGEQLFRPLDSPAARPAAYGLAVLLFDAFHGSSLHRPTAARSVPSSYLSSLLADAAGNSTLATPGKRPPSSCRIRVASSSVTLHSSEAQKPVTAA